MPTALSMVDRLCTMFAGTLSRSIHLLGWSP